MQLSGLCIRILRVVRTRSRRPFPPWLPVRLAGAASPVLGDTEYKTPAKGSEQALESKYIPNSSFRPACTASLEPVSLEPHLVSLPLPLSLATRSRAGMGTPRGALVPRLFQEQVTAQALRNNVCAGSPSSSLPRS